jgi:hypothetical protein
MCRGVIRALSAGYGWIAKTLRVTFVGPNSFNYNFNHKPHFSIQKLYIHAVSQLMHQINVSHDGQIIISILYRPKHLSVNKY